MNTYTNNTTSQQTSYHKSINPTITLGSRECWVMLSGLWSSGVMLTHCSLGTAIRQGVVHSIRKCLSLFSPYKFRLYVHAKISAHMICFLSIGRGTALREFSVLFNIKKVRSNEVPNDSWKKRYQLQIIRLKIDPTTSIYWWLTFLLNDAYRTFYHS